MTKVKLGQAWVSRVTNSSAPDMSVIGTERSPLPSAAQLKDVLNKLALSDAAREMVRRKWLQPKAEAVDRIAERGEAIFDFLFARGAMVPAYARFKGRRVAEQRNLFEEVSTMAWIAHVTDTVQSAPSQRVFKPSDLNDQFIREIAKLSAQEQGPKLALQALQSIGINVVVETGLPGMSVDGASFHLAHAGPVLALTLRHDRLDNFWFTLFHEIGHIALHLESPSSDVFVDAIEEGAGEDIEAEAEANAFAKDGLIPRDTWLRSDAYRYGNEGSVVSLARQLGIHAAIVAGRVRYERREYRILHNLVGQGEVRDRLLAD